MSERRQRLEQIDDLARQASVSIRPAFEQLRRMAAAEPQTLLPEKLDMLIEALREVDTRVRRGTPAAEAAREVREQAKFVQPNWNVGVAVNMLVSSADHSAVTAGIQPARIPIVLVVMTDKEAAELLDGTAFKRYPLALSKDFATMQAILNEAAVTDWASRYHPHPRDWLPFGSDGPPLCQIVETTIARVNEKFSFEPPLAAEFISLGAINDDRWTLRRLRSDGCLVIMDSVSMRHPTVQRAFHNSMLDAFPTTSMVVMAPVANLFDQVRELTVVLELRIADLEFAKRLRDPDEDFGSSLETTEPRMLDQWLSTRFKAIANSLGVKSGIRHYMHFGPRGGE